MTGMQTTLVGSYPFPSWLRAAPSLEGMTDAMAVVLHLQERAGIDLATDGELYRFDVNHPETNGMIEYFVGSLSGVRTTVTRADAARFAAQRHLGFRRRPAGVVAGELGEGTLDLPSAARGAQELTSLPVKFTVTSPYMLARTLLDDHYGDIQALTMAIADVLAAQVRDITADVVQLDEANLPGSPDDAAFAAKAVNRVLDAVPGRPAVHVCFGNYGGQRVQAGSLQGLHAFFADLHADHLVLETVRFDPTDLSSLADLDNVRFGVGVIDVKNTQIEAPDLVASRIEHAASALGGADRIAYVHPDCGFWVLPRSVADGKIAALVAGRIRYLG